LASLFLIFKEVNKLKKEEEIDMEKDKSDEEDVIVGEKEEMAKKRVKYMPRRQQKAVMAKLKKGEYLPFYKPSGTSVFTRRVRSDLKDLYYVPEEYKFLSPDKMKIRKKSKKKRKK